MRSKRNSPSSSMTSKEADSLMFFKVYLPDRSSQQLELPSAFVKRLKSKIPPRSLVCSRNRTWPVDVKKFNNALHFDNGWSDFVRDASLEPGDFLVFSYLGTRFNVEVYGKNGCEKSSSYVVKEVKIEQEDDRATPHHQYEQVNGYGESTNGLNDSSDGELSSGEGMNDLSNEKLSSREGTNNLSGEEKLSFGEGTNSLSGKEKLPSEEGTNNLSGREKLSSGEATNSFSGEEKLSSGEATNNLSGEKLSYGEGTNYVSGEDKLCSGEGTYNLSGEEKLSDGDATNSLLGKDKLFCGDCTNKLSDEVELYTGEGMNSLSDEDELYSEEGMNNFSDEDELYSEEGTNTLSDEDELYSGEGTDYFSKAEELSSGDSEISWESEKLICIKKKDIRVKKRPRVSTKQKEKDPNEAAKQVRAIVAYGKSSSEYPNFKIGVLPVYIYHGSLNIPMPFAQKYLKVGKVEASLQVLNKSWPVTLTTYRNGCCKISSGWLAFVRDNYIEEGDICLFELINTSTYKFRVSIFPCSS